MIKSFISPFETTGQRLIALVLSAVLLFTWFQYTEGTRLNFQDNKEFYASLAEKLKDGEKVVMRIDVNRYSDLPQQLKSVFPLQSDRFRNESKIPLRLDASRLVAIYSSSILGLGSLSAGLGALVAAATGNDPVVGAQVGGGIGVVSGIATGAVIHAIELHQHKVSFFKARFGEFSMIEIEPTV
jgi:hypothetical protein